MTRRSEAISTPYDGELADLSSASTEAGTVADLAERAVSPVAFTRGTDADPHALSTIVPEGSTWQIKRLDGLDPYPRTKAGSATVTDVDSFIAYVQRHMDPSRTTLWADKRANRIVAVLDDHAVGLLTADNADEPSVTGLAGWGEHRVTLQLTTTDDWEQWRKLDRTRLNQSQLAEHLEDLAHTVVEPDAATMVEIAQEFHATTSVRFSSVQRLRTGERQLVYTEQHDNAPGAKGDMTLPERIGISVAMFEGLEPERMDVRLRYSIGGGSLTLTYLMDRPDRYVERVFTAVADTITEATDLRVLRGTPAPARDRTV